MHPIARKRHAVGDVYKRQVHDWCISRQLWWGHRIPAFYCDACGETTVSEEDITCCPKCGGAVHQDEDVLDTWFSSALWPFSTLGWPDKTEDLDYFYPTSVLVTAYDIIFFWVARMIFSGMEHMQEKPFDHVFIHGLIRDEQGRKMSKSLGNGIDPLEMIDEYGADALRFTLATGNSPGNDIRFSMDRVQASRNFANKIWNASRFVLMNLDIDHCELPKSLRLEDKWIISRFNTVAKEVNENLEHYELGIAVAKLYDFIWDEFCDWYIELAKYRIYHADEDQEAANDALWTLREVLKNALKLLHPYMPFVTEEIYSKLIPEEESLMISPWPVYDGKWNFEAEEVIVAHYQEIIRGIRNVRAEMNVPNARKATAYVVSEDASLRDGLALLSNSAKQMASLNEFVLRQDKEGIADDAVSVVVPDATVYLPLEDLIDFEQEIERLTKEQTRLTKEIARAKGMLNNEKFVSKAPEAKVQEEREKLETYEQMMAQVTERLNGLKAK